MFLQCWQIGGSSVPKGELGPLILKNVFPRKLVFPLHQLGFSKEVIFFCKSFNRHLIKVDAPHLCHLQGFRCKSSQHGEGESEEEHESQEKPWSKFCLFCPVPKPSNLPRRLNSTERTSIFNWLNGIVLITLNLGLTSCTVVGMSQLVRWLMTQDRAR